MQDFFEAFKDSLIDEESGLFMQFVYNAFPSTGKGYIGINLKQFPNTKTIMTVVCFETINLHM